MEVTLKPPFPTQVAFDDARRTIVTEWAGEPLDASNAPEDVVAQTEAILGRLSAAKCRHNDIKPEDLLVRDGRVVLADYGWASPLDAPSECAGYLVMQRASLAANITKLVVAPARRRAGVGGALLAAAGKLRETLAHAAVRGDDAAAKVWIGRLDGDSNDDTNDDADDSGVKPPSMDQSSNDSDSGYVLPGAIASLSRWRSVAPVHRTAQILGVANCPRLRMLRGAGGLWFRPS